MEQLREQAQRASAKLAYLLGVDPGLTLVPVSLCPVALGLGGPGYALGAVILALAFLRPIWAFCRRRSIAAARRVLRASLVYLPGILAFLLISKYWLP